MTSSSAKTTNHISRAQHKSSRKGERGVTIFIVAAGMVSLLAMAVLAIDVVTLYVASGQAQQAADAAALAGAAAFSSSGFTSAPTIVAQSSVCNGSSGDADMLAGGSNNPNPLLRTAASISRSDSIVTVPVFNCPAIGACDGTAQLPIVGFLQLGIQYYAATGDISVVVLNVAGCDPSNPGFPISGAGVSPVPVRVTR